MVDLKGQYAAIKERVNASIQEVIDTTAFINGPQVQEFQKELETYLGVKHVIPCANGTDALQVAMMGLNLQPGDEIITADFTFAATVEVIALLQLTPVLVDVDPINFNIDIAAIEKAITSKTKAIVICNPGNPTGYLYSKEELERLRDIVLKHDLFLFADEVYREFCYDGAVPFSVMNLEGIENNVIMIDSVSKRYSMCGARIGAIITKNKEVMASALKFGQARLSPPTIDQIASEAALDTPQSYFDNVISEYVERRNITVEGLNNIPGVYCPMPSGAFYCVAKFPVKSAEHFCQWLLEEFEFEGATVMMAPANGFYSTKGKGEQEARIAYVLNKESLKSAVKCLEEALKVYPGKI